MTELFKPHPIYSDYLIGNNGTVISTKRPYRDRAGKLYFKDQYKIQTQHKCGMKGNKKPHLRVSITKDGTHRSVYVHHLVLETFVSPRKNKNTITNHKDGNPSNNNVLNLEWCPLEDAE